MQWCYEHDAWITTLPRQWGGGQASAWRQDEDWHAEGPGFTVALRNPRLRYWSTARSVIDATLRAHFTGPVAAPRTPWWPTGQDATDRRYARQILSVGLSPTIATPSPRCSFAASA